MAPQQRQLLLEQLALKKQEVIVVFDDNHQRQGPGEHPEHLFQSDSQSSIISIFQNLPIAERFFTGKDNQEVHSLLRI